MAPSLGIPQLTPPFASAPSVPSADAPAADFSDLDPEMLRRLADLYGISYDEAATMIRLKKSEMLANKEAPRDGRAYGGVYTASNPLEVLGPGLMQAMGLGGMNGAANAMSGLGARKAMDAYSQYQLFGAKPLSF